MYKLPIEIVHGMKFDDSIEREITTALNRSIDEYIYQSIVNVGVNVDKDELIKALSYDRQQYKKGYADGVKAVIKKIKEKSFDNLMLQGWTYSEIFLDSIAEEMVGDAE